MQINRLFEVVYILLDKKTVTAKELAERFEVSSRTIYRDIETLSSAGIPVYMSKGKGGGISLLPDFVLNKAVLTDEEKEDILSSLKAVKAVNLSKTDTALKKLSSLFGESNTDWIGNEVSKPENDELTVKMIPAGKYAKFSVHGHMEKAVAEAWGEIWKIDLDRSFTGDFEEYLNSDWENSDIDIYIALK